jgi:predicted ATP-dependent endonuclease of OLD family
MQLQSLSIVGLHGALTLDVSFNEAITLLVGINGSGKTSVLNAVEWLLKPDMKQLATAVYSRLCLKFTEGKTPYVLTATKSAALVILSLEGTKVPLKPIKVKLLHEASLDDEMESELYRGLEPEKDEMPMWQLLKSFARPTAISLDRTISAESDDIEYIETPRGPMARRARAKAPLAYVQEITSQKYAEFRSKAIIHDSELKAEIVMSALQNSEIGVQSSLLKPLNASDITKLEAKVVSYLTSTVKSGDIANQIHRFFESAKMLTEKQNLESKQHDLLVEFVSSRYRQIERMAKAFNDFENKNATAFRKLSTYLNALNRFFRDSNKELYFDPSTGRLVFSFVDGQSREEVCRSITFLSSGERQILILFTFLAFSSSSQSVFIVDEPELSLHPKWQHEFMEAFLGLRPKGTQLVLATHSPDIVGKHKSACVTLRSPRR